MTDVKIILNMENCFETVFPGRSPSELRTARIRAIGALPGGMSSGLPSVTVMIETTDGTIAMAETSLRLFQMANAALSAVYGDVNSTRPDGVDN